MSTEVRLLAAAVLSALISAATAGGAQTKGPSPSSFQESRPPRTFYVAPTPAPLAPPTNPGPAIAPPAALSPLLTQPSQIFRIPERASPSYPASHGASIYAEILGAAEAAEADLVVVGSHRPAMKDYLLGTNAARVVRHARCSVLVARE